MIVIKEWYRNKIGLGTHWNWDHDVSILVLPANNMEFGTE